MIMMSFVNKDQINKSQSMIFIIHPLTVMHCLEAVSGVVFPDYNDYNRV